MSKEKLLLGEDCRGHLITEETKSGLTRIVFETDVANAELYLQGAHLTQWTPAGGSPVLFLSRDSAFVPGKAIRGGVPVIFPWFGARTATPSDDRTDGPAHGFARTSEWQLNSVVMEDKNVLVELSLSPNDLSKSLGYDHFLLTYKLTIGSSLTMQLVVQNQSEQPLYFEEALHSYFHVFNFDTMHLNGLAGIDFLDKTDGFKRKTQSEDNLVIKAETDRVYLNTEGPVYIDDAGVARRITVEKENSKNTVVWNPGPKVRPKIMDMSDDEWTSMVCVEAANVGDNRLTLEPNGKHVMQTRVSTSQIH